MENLSLKEKLKTNRSKLDQAKLELSQEKIKAMDQHEYVQKFISKLKKDHQHALDLKDQEMEKLKQENNDLKKSKINDKNNNEYALISSNSRKRRRIDSNGNGTA